jgi:uncharacterized SAM-binding protein YcdF (DUF218 family)
MIMSTPFLSILRRSIIALLTLLLFLWLILFLQFFSSISLANLNKTSNADAIIVLTGGDKRLAAGFELLSKGYAKLLFVSGVNRSVTPFDIWRLSHEQNFSVSHELINCCVKLGYNAFNTRGNAIESAEWIENNKIHSILLVTSNYHMKRSHLEFSLRAPNVSILEYPVVGNNVVLDDWWLHPRSMGVLLSEYNKYILTVLSSFVMKIIS